MQRIVGPDSNNALNSSVKDSRLMMHSICDGIVNGCYLSIVLHNAVILINRTDLFYSWWRYKQILEILELNHGFEGGSMYLVSL